MVSTEWRREKGSTSASWTLKSAPSRVVTTTLAAVWVSSSRFTRMRDVVDVGALPDPAHGRARVLAAVAGVEHHRDPGQAPAP